MNVELTNNQVVNLTSFSGLHTTFVVHNTISQDTQYNFNDVLHFHPDAAMTMDYNNGEGRYRAIGEHNNLVMRNDMPQYNWSFPYCFQTVNVGRIKRMLNTSDNGQDAQWLTTTSSYQNLNTIRSSLRNYCTLNKNPVNSPDPFTRNITYYITATIDLKILHDFFAKLPLIKGAYMRLTFNTNCGSVATMSVSSPVQLQAGGGIYDNARSGFFNSVNISSPHNVFPCQITGIGEGLPLLARPLDGNGVPAQATLRLSLDIAKVSSSIQGTSTVASHALNQCRIYCAMYEMTPQLETRYLSSNSTKKILYNDILSFQTLNTPAGGQVNQILTVGVSRPRYLLGIPYLSASINGSQSAFDPQVLATPVMNGVTVNAAAGLTANYPAGQQFPFSVLSSPFTSSPCTTSIGMRISNFNVLMSGVNIYSENITYNFLEYQNEVRGAFALNGGLDLSLSSGGISQKDWEQSYGYVFVDLSRRLSSADDNVARSIQVSYTNNTNVVQDMYWFCCFEREITINTATGALVL